jgi:hypothetical protein
MKKEDVRKTAFAMPLTNRAYPPGPYRFSDREYLIITYRTDADKLRAVVPEPLGLMSLWSNSNSSVCRIRPDLGTTPRADICIACHVLSWHASGPT